MNFIFYLRHLLLMDRQFYISFIIINHMRHAYKVKNTNLPYVNLVNRIFRLHMRDIPQRERIRPTNLFYELSNLGWVNNLVGEPPVWTPNNRHPINKWIRDPNTKLNQYIDPNTKELFLELEPIHDIDVRTSSQPQHQVYTSMPSFSFDPYYQSSFDPYMA
jgi:hypothetical protein